VPLILSGVGAGFLLRAPDAGSLAAI